MATTQTPQEIPRGRSTVDRKMLHAERSVEEHHHTQNVSPSQKTAMPRWRSKGKNRSTIAQACTWVVDHQISISVYLISLLFTTHFCFPSTSHHTSKFFRISYYNPSTGRFALGWDDIWFVFYWIIVFTGMRCAVMDYILTPLAAYSGIRKKKAKVRFAEQAWILIYDAGFWSTGMYIMYNSEYWLDLRALWRDWPIREMDGLSKWYYLVQFAFWLQQIVVVNIEEKRKDYAQMFTHHIITCTLIFTSYGYHQTRVGNLILCLMDVVDLFLPLAKILNYLNFPLPRDITFGVFMVTWFIARHIFYMWVCWSIYAHIPQEIQYGCYKGSMESLQGPFPVPNDWSHLVQPFKDPAGLVCWNENIKWVFLVMLGALQCVLLVWFIMIIKVAYKVLFGNGAEDVRSDDEDEDDEDEVKEELDEIKNVQAMSFPVGKSPTSDFNSTKHGFSAQAYGENGSLNTVAAETNVGSTPSPAPGMRRSSRRRNDGHSSGVNLLATSPKELLGRIGCEKGADH